MNGRVAEPLPAGAPGDTPPMARRRSAADPCGMTRIVAAKAHILPGWDEAAPPDMNKRRDAGSEPGWDPLDPPRGGQRRPAVFLDRDGTLIEDVPYLSDPSAIRFLPGAAEALVRLGHAGFARVLVTNQSGIGRGFFTEERLREIHDELEGRLAAVGASLDGIYYCPAAPDEGAGQDCPDRKPAPGMLLRGAVELGIDLDASWMVGDKMSDVLAGLNAGCRSILLRAGPAASDGPGPADPAAAGRFLVAHDLAAAVDLILDGEDQGR
jgi:D,D-heptose 1,7-bisphosphate phosphatase